MDELFRLLEVTGIKPIIAFRCIVNIRDRNSQCLGCAVHLLSRQRSLQMVLLELYNTFNIKPSPRIQSISNQFCVKLLKTWESKTHYYLCH